MAAVLEADSARRNAAASRATSTVSSAVSGDHCIPSRRVRLMPPRSPICSPPATASPTPRSRWAPRSRRRHGPPGAQDQDPARDDEPPRPHRRRHRHRQDQDAAAPHRAARRRRACPVFAADIKGDLSGLAMPGEASDRVTGRAKDVGWAWKPAGVPVEFVSLTRQARRPAPRHGQLVRPAAPGQGALAQRDPDQRAHDGLQVLRRQPAAAARPVRPPRGAAVPLAPTRASRRWRSTAACPGATVGVLLRKMVELESQGAGAVLRRAGVRRQGHAARSPPTGAASSPVSSWPTCRTSRCSGPPS